MCVSVCGWGGGGGGSCLRHTMAIARLLFNLEEELGKPQDFEWGIEEGEWRWERPRRGLGVKLSSGGEGCGYPAHFL